MIGEGAVSFARTHFSERSLFTMKGHEYATNRPFCICLP